MIHVKEQPSDADKLANLQHAVKDNTTKYAMKGLIQSVGSYK